MCGDYDHTTGHWPTHKQIGFDEVVMESPLQPKNSKTTGVVCVQYVLDLRVGKEGVIEGR